PGTGLWRLMATAAADGADEPAPEELLTLIVRLFSERTGSSVVQGAEWTSTFQIHRRLAETYRRGRMLLAGDAAHIHSPLGAQGAHLPLRGHRRPGDRVPDMSCRRREGGLTRLHAELGAKWVLLTAPTPAGEACASVLRDRLGAEAFTVLEPADGRVRHALLI